MSLQHSVMWYRRMMELVNNQNTGREIFRNLINIIETLFKGGLLS